MTAPKPEIVMEGLGEVAPPKPGSFLRKHARKLVVSIFLGGGLAWMLSRGGLPLVPPASAFAQVKPLAIAGYLVSLAALSWFRAWRWRHLLKPVGNVPVRSTIAVGWVGYAAILFSPFRSGEVVRPYLISKRGQVSVWEATGTVGAERILDGLVMTLALLAGLLVATPLSPLPDHIGSYPISASAVPKAAYSALALFFAAFAAMGLFFWRRDLARRLTLAVFGVFSKRFATRLADIASGVASGLKFLPSSRAMVPFLIETLLYWGSNIGGVWLLAWGTGLEGVTLAEAAVIVGCVGVGILVPAGPGFFGAFQLSSYMALAMYFPEHVVTGIGSAFVFLLYVLQVGFNVLTAGIAFLIDPDVIRSQSASEAAGDADR